MVVNIGFVVLAYLLGSISFGILMSKAFGLPDPRTVGSGNIGATNIARSGKKLPYSLECQTRLSLINNPTQQSQYSLPCKSSLSSFPRRGHDNNLIVSNIVNIKL